ncbi:MAG: magnesium transporter [bacterium]|jgi:magnesium transporter
MSKKLTNVIEKITLHLESGERENVIDIFNQSFPSDIAYILSHVQEVFEPELFDIALQLPKFPEVLPELDARAMTLTVQKLKKGKGENISQLFSLLDSNDIASILTEIPEKLANWVRDNLAYEESLQTELLLKYEEGTAGRIMSTDFFSVNESTTVLEAFTSLKEIQSDLEMIYYVYITNDQDQLVGVASLRQLITRANHLSMKEIMHTNLVTTLGQQDQEMVAMDVERYNLSAIPVLNSNQKIIGIITVDDVIDVIREEATEDIMKLAGTTEKEFSLGSPVQGFLLRMPWLLVSFFGGLLTVQSMTLFSKIIPHTLLLAFVPVIAGMGGNIGSQSTTIIVRGLATGQISTNELWRVVLRELSIGILLGLFFGTILAFFAEMQFQEVAFIGGMVAIGMFFSMVIAAIIGSLMPMLFHRFNIDPAIAAGPFVTTTIDNIGLLGYLASSILIVRFMGGV